MRTTLISLSVFLPSLAIGQCHGAIDVYHPFGDCSGYIGVLCPLATDSVVWSDGRVGSNLSFAPGMYGYVAYGNGTVVDARDSIMVEQLTWEINAAPSWTGTGPTIQGDASVRYCTTSMWNFPCCIPVPAQTFVRLVQDGTTEITTEACINCMDMVCFGTSFVFHQVPTGHAYNVRLYDLACGNVVTDTTTIIVNACDHLELSVSASGTPEGSMEGSVHLDEVIPDPTEPYPLVAPVIGTATLYRGLEGFDEVGVHFNVSSASWNGLDTGYYRVQFIPVSGCNQVTYPIHVGISSHTGMDGAPLAPALQVRWTEDARRITLHTTGGILDQVQWTDLLGRPVPVRGGPGGTYDLVALAPGLYVVRASVGATLISTRFLVR